MQPGRSNASVLLVAKRNLHWFAWAPWTGAESFGTMVRWRRGDVWTHLRLILFQRNRPSRDTGRFSKRVSRVYRRRTLTIFELSRWQTSPGTNDRIGVKSYLRLKAGPGGREA